VQESAASFLTFYRVDGKDRILEVGGAWDTFAKSNDGEPAIGGRVIGTHLLDHISGDVSRMYVRTVFDAVRILGRQATRAYRCDSPTQKRFMEMTVTPESAGSLLVEHRLLRAENFVRPLGFVPGIPGRTGTRVRCSMCNRLKIGADWREIDHPTNEAFSTGPVAVVYGVCSSCLAGIRQFGAST
jgi:hypothetical protein